MNNKKHKYIKADAFTFGQSAGNPAAAIFTEEYALPATLMQKIAAEHKGFVMEMVFCAPSSIADCKLTYYSSECEVDFCGHGTIATMYTLIKQRPDLLSRKVIKAETNRKGVIEVFNEIDAEDAVYITAPDPIELPVRPSSEQIREALKLPQGAIREDLPIRIIDAGLRTLIVPIGSLHDEVTVYPDEQRLKAFAEDNDIDIVLIFSMQTSMENTFAHTRVFAPRFGYLEDPATGSGNSAFANYLLSQHLWNGHLISIEQGGDNRIYNIVKLKCSDGKVLFGGKATLKIDGWYVADVD